MTDPDSAQSNFRQPASDRSDYIDVGRPGPDGSDADELRADIERTRAELADTVEQLSDKLKPSTQAHRAADNAKHAVSQRTAQVKAAAPEPVRTALDRAAATVGPAGRTVNDATRPHRAKIALAGAALVVVAVVVRRRRRR